MLTENVDDLIRAAERELARLSTECAQEIERATARIKEKYAREMERYSDSIAHLEAVKANLSGRAQHRPPSGQKHPELYGGVNARNKLGGKFPVTEEVKRIVRELKGHYSLEDIYHLFDERHRGVRKTLNRTSIHRAVNLLVRSGAVEKVGRGRYKNKD